MKKIQYVGPFWKVESEGVSFTRYTPVEVSAEVAAKLLAQNPKDGKALFEDVNAARVPVLVEDEA